MVRCAETYRSAKAAALLVGSESGLLMLGQAALSPKYAMHLHHLQRAPVICGKLSVFMDTESINAEPLGEEQPQPLRRVGELAARVAAEVASQLEKQAAEKAYDDETGTGYDKVRRSFTSPMARRIANAVRRAHLEGQ
jgi:hypothetical protein